MISVSKAKDIIQNRVQPLHPVVVSLGGAAGLVLAEDIFAPENMPRFAQSAMDGFAFNFNDLSSTKTLEVSGEVAAGDDGLIHLEPGTAIRIFTGAPLPQGADVVVMQEKTKTVSGAVVIEDDTLASGTNVRAIGSEMQQGQLALPKGTFLTPGAIGLIASLGIADVSVFPSPKITMLITGKELVAPGQPVTFGQIHESNSYALKAALKMIGVYDVQVAFVTDTLEAVQTALEVFLPQSDMVLLTGGVSVGAYDFVVDASKNVGVEQHFHKVAQKPGKPLFFGTWNNKPVFGLPGNPGSVLTCFYQYVLPAVKKIMQQEGWTNGSKMPLGIDVHKKAGLTHFLKGRIDESGVYPLGAQESFRLSSFAFADCLIELGEEVETLEKGSLVQVHHLLF